MASPAEVTAYSPPHLVVLAILAAGALVLVVACPRLRRSGDRRLLALTLAWGLSCPAAPLDGNLRPSFVRT